jgi:hypothetical protein
MECESPEVRIRGSHPSANCAKQWCTHPGVKNGFDGGIFPEIDAADFTGAVIDELTHIQKWSNIDTYMDTHSITAVQSAVAGFPWDTAVDLSRKEDRVRLSPAAIKGVMRIARKWDLRDEDTRALLGGVSNGSFYALKHRGTKTLDEDHLTRISLLIGIYKALNILYSPKLADAWVTLPNTNAMFGGDAPLTYMKRGGIPAFLRVRQLLDARRGGR